MMTNILITWISSWIGNYLAKFLNNQYKIYGLCRNNPKITGVKFCEVDLSKPSLMKQWVKDMKEKNTVFDTIVFNAGIGYFDEFTKISDKENLEMLMTNLYANIFLTKHLLASFSPANLVFIGSIASKKFMKYGAVYQASKFGLRWFVGALRDEVKPDIFLINPKYVKGTKFHEHSTIPIPEKWFPETKMAEILKVVKNILNGKEKRFEIDL